MGTVLKKGSVFNLQVLNVQNSPLKKLLCTINTVQKTVILQYSFRLRDFKIWCGQAAGGRKNGVGGGKTGGGREWGGDPVFLSWRCGGGVLMVVGLELLLFPRAHARGVG